MPFIKQERREVIDQFGLMPPEGSGFKLQPGDRCYYFYEQMVSKWKENPRWTTAHEIYKQIMYNDYNIIDDDDFAALELAWQVFFIKYVMPYEDEKEKENGTI